MNENETPQDRTIRVINPKINKLRERIYSLAKSLETGRYPMTEQQKEELLNTLKEDIFLLEQSITKKQKAKKEFENIL
jgi:hypothetical protein